MKCSRKFIPIFLYGHFCSVKMIGKKMIGKKMLDTLHKHTIHWYENAHFSMDFIDIRFEIDLSKNLKSLSCINCLITRNSEA